MSDLDEIHEMVLRLAASHEDLAARVERTFRPGRILEAADIDLSDPTNPLARIHHDNDQDGNPVKGPFVRYATWAGDRNQHTPPSVDQQFIHVSPDGDMEAGFLVPLGPSRKVVSPETDGATHVDEHGTTKRTLKKDSLTQTVGGTQVHQDEKDHKVTVPGKAEITAGDPSAANSSGAGDLTNFPHELNRIVQGFAGRLDQHDHHIAALHDTMSTLNTLAIPKVPALAQLAPKLNNDPTGLKICADDVLAKLPNYAANAIEQTLAKLLATPLGSVVEAVQGDLAGQMAGLLGQAQSLVAGAGLAAGDAAAAQMFLGQAQAGAAASAAGGHADLQGALSSLTSLLSGTPQAGPLAGLVGEMQAIMGDTSGLMGGLPGLLDGQVNATKGTIRSALFGGY